MVLGIRIIMAIVEMKMVMSIVVSWELRGEWNEICGNVRLFKLFNILIVIG